MTVSEWLKYWLEDIIRPNREDTAYYCYSIIIKNHILPVLGNIRIQDLTPPQIQAYYTQMIRDKGLHPNTVHKHHILLHTALKTAYRQKILLENPVELVEAPRMQLPKQYYYNTNQLRKLFQLVVKLAGYLGLRRSEICGLRWEQVATWWRNVRRQIALSENWGLLDWMIWCGY